MTDEALRRIIREEIRRTFQSRGDRIVVRFDRPDAPMFASEPVFEVAFKEEDGGVSDDRMKGDAFTVVRAVGDAMLSVIDQYPDTQAFYLVGATGKRGRVFPEMIRRILPRGWEVDTDDLGFTWIKRRGYETPGSQDPFRA